MKILFLLSLSTGALAQEAIGFISGTVYDEKGNVQSTDGSVTGKDGHTMQRVNSTAIADAIQESNAETKEGSTEVQIQSAD